MENKINFSDMSLTDIIFIDRNKAYGAYEIRQSYNQHIKHALMGTLLMTVFASAYQNIYAMIHPTAEYKVIETICHVNDIKTTEIKPPKLPKEEVKVELKKGNPKAATSAYREMKVTRDDTPHLDTIAPIRADIAIADVTAAGIKGETDGVDKGSAVIEMHVKSAPQEPQTVSWADVMPEYPGGEDALLTFIKKNIHYPDYENEMNIQGKAIVGFVIDEYGKVGNVSMVRGVSKGIDRESMRVVSMLRDFKPGMQGGKKVRVRYVIPIDFHQRDE